MPELPLLSVILPVFNGAMTLAAALSSLVAQDGAALEIIVVDDGSTDASAAIARSFGETVLCVHQMNQGPAAARNAGISLAQGDFIGFLDADDRWPQGRVRHHLAIMTQSPEIDLVIGRTQTFGRATGRGESVPLLPAPMIQHQVGAMTARRRVFDQVGLFDPTLRIGEDKDWFQRVLMAGVSLHLARAIALAYQVRSGSLTDGLIDRNHWFLTAIRNHLRERRCRAVQDHSLDATNGPRP